MKNKIALLGAAILIAILFARAAAPLFTPYDPVTDMVLSDMLMPPGSPGHILGQTMMGAISCHGFCLAAGRLL